MPVSVKFGSFDLDSYISTWQGSVRRRVNEQIVPRRDGLLIEEAKLSGYEVSVQGGWEVLSPGTPQDLRDAKDGLMEGLLGQGKAKLRKFDDRYWWAQLRDLIFIDGQGLLSFDFEAVFIAEEPYEIADTLSSDVEAVTTDPQSWSVTTGGTAKTLPVVKVEATGGALADALRLENTTNGTFFAYHGTLAATKILVVDCKEQTVTVDGSSVLSDFEGDFWPLLKGSNSIRFDGDPCQVTVEWYDRWY